MTMTFYIYSSKRKEEQGQLKVVFKKKLKQTPPHNELVGRSSLDYMLRHEDCQRADTWLRLN